MVGIDHLIHLVAPCIGTNMVLKTSKTQKLYISIFSHSIKKEKSKQRHKIALIRLISGYKNSFCFISELHTAFWNKSCSFWVITLHMVNYIFKAGSWELGCGSEVRGKRMRCQLHAQWLFSVFGWTEQYYHTQSYYLLHDTKAWIQAIVYYCNLPCVIHFQKRSYC